MEHILIDHANYGIYRPAFENHVYSDLTISAVTSEPFNREPSTCFGSGFPRKACTPRLRSRRFSASLPSR